MTQADGQGEMTSYSITGHNRHCPRMQRHRNAIVSLGGYCGHQTIWHSLAMQRDRGVSGKTNVNFYSTQESLPENIHEEHNLGDVMSDICVCGGKCSRFWRCPGGCGSCSKIVSWHLCKNVILPWSRLFNSFFLEESGWRRSAWISAHQCVSEKS